VRNSTTSRGRHPQPSRVLPKLSKLLFPLPLPHLPSPPSKTSPPSIKGNQLPQVVIRVQDWVDAKNRPSFTLLVPDFNYFIHEHPRFLHIHVVGVKWTSGSNLLVCAQAPSPSVLIEALEMAREAITRHGIAVKDIIPNTRWSCVTLSHVYTGKSC